jgi:adenylate cyclase
MILNHNINNNRMIRYLILSVLVLINIDCFPQDEEYTIDSIKLSILRQNEDSAKVNSLIHLGTIYLNSDVNQALIIGQEAKELATKINYKNGQGYSFKLLGQAYASLGNYLESIIEFKTSLSYFEETNNKDGVSNILNNLGSVYFLMGDDAKSIENHLMSLTVAEQIGNKIRIATNYNNIGTVYLNKKATTNKALTYYLLALPIFKEIDYSDGVGIVSGNIGEIYFNKSMYDSALYYFETYVEIFEGMPDAAYGLSYIGEIYANKNNFDNAFKYHDEAIKIAEKFDVKLDLAQSLFSLANTQYMNGNLAASINTYKRSQKISEELKARQEIRKTYEALAATYADLGDFKNAYNYEYLLTKIKDTLYNTDEDKKIQQLQFNFSIDKKESEIDLLTKDQALKESIIQRQKIISYAAMVTGVLLLIVVIGFYNRYKYIRKTNNIIKSERDRSKELLLNILPEETARELETNGFAKTHYYESVTVLFTDFKGFSTIAGKLTPQALVAELNDYFGTFDEIIGQFGLEKIKTIGDAYMCAGGIPLANNTHPISAIKSALAMQEYMLKKNIERQSKGEQGWELRIGIHTGPIVAGVVGKKKYAYDIWGDTVNLASRMESNGEAGKVNISASTYELIKDEYQCFHRGKISAKNIGEVDMYFIEDKIRQIS